jgi:hypothetical protein
MQAVTGIFSSLQVKNRTVSVINICAVVFKIGSA